MTLILLARITGAHGIRGEVKLRSFASDPKSLTAFGPLHTSDHRSIEITSIKPSKDEFICTLKNVTDRNAAEALKGAELFVAREKMPALTDQFYLADLEGKVIVSAGVEIGRVSGFQNFGAGDLIELDNGVLVPVKFVTAAGKTIEVELPDGFLDSE